MIRGDLITVALPGDFGKPRPALIVQSDLFNQTHPTVTLLPLTSDIRGAPLFRITVEPSTTNGLRQVSQIMIDKLMTLRRDELKDPFGRIEDDTMLRVGRALAVWIGLA
ncbi:MAG: type II toxin-antitoxin system PemK/MazF family toxin [Geminicoccaceae bacterium]|nr:type II toxin-antitoxin system PemK/MazF family toxin [Geminicoccaceae bacterium]